MIADKEQQGVGNVSSPRHLIGYCHTDHRTLAKTKHGLGLAGIRCGWSRAGTYEGRGRCGEIRGWGDPPTIQGGVGQ